MSLPDLTELFAERAQDGRADEQLSGVITGANQSTPEEILFLLNFYLWI